MARHDAKEMVTVHVYRAEEGGFWAEMPEYPGCYTQGEDDGRTQGKRP